MPTPCIRRTHSTTRILCAGLVLALLCLGPHPKAAWANEGSITSLDTERFRPAADGSAGFAVSDPTVPSLGRFSVQLSVHNAFSPLVLMRENGEKMPLVSNRLSGVFSGIVGLGGPFALGVALPITFFQSGSLATVPSSMRPDGSGELGVAGLGDLLLAPRIGLLQQNRHGVDLSLDGSVAIPTGRSDAFQGDGGFGGMVSASLGRSWDGSRFILLTGARFRPEGEILSVPIGHELVVRFAAIQRLGSGSSRILPRQLIGEVDISTLFTRPFDGLTTPGEWRLGARICPGAGMVITAGAGGGFTPAYGTPVARAILSLGWDPRACSPATVVDEADVLDDDTQEMEQFPPFGVDDELLEAGEEESPEDEFEEPGELCEGLECEEQEDSVFTEPVDSDGDGIPDEDDACPQLFGLAEFQGCPGPDRDGDGLLDDDDFCPDLPGPAEMGGCPPLPGDRDGDGIPDSEDRCPNLAGPAESFGCPLRDSDNDGLYDHEDNCPQQPGPARFQGCAQPQLVQLSGRQIELLEEMVFIPDTPQLDRQSSALLENLAEVILAHPEFWRIEISGHLDDSFDPDEALSLSEARAESVVAALSDRGVNESRLVAVGHGSNQPIAANVTPRGRRANRRIEVWILGQSASSPESAHPDSHPDEDQPLDLPLDLLDLELTPLVPIETPEADDTLAPSNQQRGENEEIWRQTPVPEELEEAPGNSQEHSIFSEEEGNISAPPLVPAQRPRLSREAGAPAEPGETSAHDAGSSDAGSSNTAVSAPTASDSNGRDSAESETKGQEEETPEDLDLLFELENLPLEL